MVSIHEYLAIPVERVLLVTLYAGHDLTQRQRGIVEVYEDFVLQDFFIQAIDLLHVPGDISVAANLWHILMFGCMHGNREYG